MGWTVVIPVKRLGEAKSRLRTSATPTDVTGLALAFAIDTATVAIACARVVVVTSDPVVTTRMSALGASVVPDPGGGLNAAIVEGVATVTGPVAVLTGDLPALRADEFAAVLADAAHHRLGTVPDREGTGTTVLTALDPRMLHPRFGVGSNALHRRSGHTQLDAGVSVRADVDTDEGLAVALELGVGAATISALTRTVLGI